MKQGDVIFVTMSPLFDTVLLFFLVAYAIILTTLLILLSITWRAPNVSSKRASIFSNSGNEET